MSFRDVYLGVISNAAEVANGKDYAELSRACMMLLRYQESHRVREMIHGADWDDRVVMQQVPALSQYLWLAGDVEGSLALLEHSKKYLHANAPLLYSMGMALRSAGRMDEATQAFEAAVSMDEDFSPAHWILATHQRASVAGSRLPRLRAALQRTKSSENATELLYSLHRELDHAGENERAFKALDAGMTLKRKGLKHNASAKDAALAKIRSWMSLPDEVGESGFRPIFVVGMPRSGTTLLERMLSQLPGTFSAGELRDFEMAVSHQANEYYRGMDDASVLASLPDVLANGVGRRYRERVEKLLPSNDVRVIDKYPGNFFSVPLIARALPDARIVAVVKSPMDSGFSNLKELFADDAYGYSYAQDEVAEHYVAMLKLAKEFMERYPKQFLAVSYDQLVQDPSRVLERVCAFVDLPFDAGAVDVTRNRSAVSTASSTQVREKVHQGFLGNWRKYGEYLAPMQQRFEELGVDPLAVPEFLVVE